MSESGSSTTSGRLLRLLSLLQTPREWPGPELAERLGVSQRTIRNDVDRLRGLGYPVSATRGSVGGYRLAAGTAMPPLLLDDDEAVAVAVALATASGGSVDGVEETSLRALTKLMQVLPKRLAGRVDALQAHTVRVGARRARNRSGPHVDGQLLALLAGVARDREVLRFAYSDHTGSASERRVEPYRLVSWGRRWYLVAFDVERDDWRTFRIDRMQQARSVGHRFRLRDLPADDIAAYVAEKTRAVQTKVTGRVVVHLSATRVEQRMGWWVEGGVEPLADDRCRVTIGGRSPEDVAFWLGALDADFEVEDSPDLAAAVRRVSERYSRAVG